MNILWGHYKKEFRHLVFLLLFPLQLLVELPKFFGTIGVLIFPIFLWFGFAANYNWNQIIWCGFGGVVASALGFVTLLMVVFGPWCLLAFLLRLSVITLTVIVGRFYPKVNDLLEVFEH